MIEMCRASVQNPIKRFKFSWFMSFICNAQALCISVRLSVCSVRVCISRTEDHWHFASDRIIANGTWNRYCNFRIKIKDQGQKILPSSKNASDERLVMQRANLLMSTLSSRCRKLAQFAQFMHKLKFKGSHILNISKSVCVSSTSLYWNQVKSMELLLACE